MSSRGATWRGRHEQRFDQKIRSRKNQRNRRIEDRERRGQLVDFPFEKLEYFVKRCREKQAHRTLGAAYRAKKVQDEMYGVEHFVYECPICSFFHLTTHPWDKD